MTEQSLRMDSGISRHKAPTSKLVDLGKSDTGIPILKVLQNLPDIAAEDVDELEGLIKSGKLPVRIQGEFGGEEARDRHGKAFQIR